jgi:hypothetical protein
MVAGLVLAGSATTAAAEAYQGPAAYRTSVFWSPADRFWSGGVAPQACLRTGRKAAALSAAPRLQAAAYEQRGELIGEIRAAPAIAPRVVAQAHSCATEADSATTTYALLTDADRNWGVFRSAFSTCMRRNNTAQYVGSMTLWIDQACNW